MEDHLFWEKKKPSVFSRNVILSFKTMGEPSKVEYQTPRALMHEAEGTMANWVLAMATLMTKIKAMMTIFLRELQEHCIKAPNCPEPSLRASTTHSLAELGCPFLRRKRQLGKGA